MLPSPRPCTRREWKKEKDKRIGSQSKGLVGGYAEMNGISSLGGVDVERSAFRCMVSGFLERDRRW
jgi:hypothetical protein